jgi:hypothetical protein
MRRIKELVSEKSSAMRALDMLPDNSRATRFGKRAILLGALVDAAQPVLTAVGVILLTSVSALAQGSGGSIFGQDQNMVPNAIRQTVIFLSGIAFLVGAGACIWGAFNYTRRQECVNQFIGGGMLMTIGGIIALISYLSGGRAVTVNRDL